MVHLAAVAIVLSLVTPASTSLKTADGRTREYNEHMPAHVDAKAALPVLIILHGGGGNAEQIEHNTDFDRASDAHGFLAVYPDGTGKAKFHTWNGSGTCCGPAMRDHVDDVAFLVALVDDLAKHHNIDRKRVFVVGHSNGAVMAERALCEKPEIFAGGVIVSSPGLDHACTPKAASRVLIIHGTADRCASYTPSDKCGGCWQRSMKAIFGVDMKDDTFPCSGAQAIASYWRAPTAVVGTDVVTRTVGAAQCVRPAKSSVPVELCTIEGGGHAFPGSTSNCKPGRKLCDDIAQEVGQPANLDVPELAVSFLFSP
jgi:polyhydroxybutyrate depolymerase